MYFLIESVYSFTSSFPFTVFFEVNNARSY